MLMLAFSKSLAELYCLNPLWDISVGLPQRSVQYFTVLTPQPFSTWSVPDWGKLIRRSQSISRDLS